MTAADFIAAGVVFDRTARGPRVLAPKGRSDLGLDVRAQITRRLSLVRELDPAAAAAYGTCETCGDPMAPYVAGMCDLCGFASFKALLALGRITA